ncbi:hypothetical protein QAD02_005963 [Eretmocerus hayati]|uniref:Uncharacterized protein n=1 Tax=Eretmocerus hayati TaxID=131215 RepID=A0ACC2N0R4_9HYME|nr:hypothetical protein QAD02_005963 [Eretmocerus hayati]
MTNCSVRHRIEDLEALLYGLQLRNEKEAHKEIDISTAINGEYKLFKRIQFIYLSLVCLRTEAATKVLPTSQLSKAISRISTEYRLQFAWPRRQAQLQLTNGDVTSNINHQNNQQQQTVDQQPRKSMSMGALRQGSMMSATGAALAPVHKKRQSQTLDHRRGRDGAQASELEPLVASTTTQEGALPELDEHDETDASAVTAKRSGTRQVRIAEQQSDQTRPFKKGQERPFSAAEVLELRRELKRLADEYKLRDWGGYMGIEDEATLWKQVSTNHALNALSLARSATKEEKEKENTRKIGPGHAVPVCPAAAGRPSSVMHPDDSRPDNDRALARQARRDFLIRHHLDRTTGAGDGALLPSPTREKLEPAIPRRRDDQSEPSTRAKFSPKSSPRSARSQSVGPSVVERSSPKRRLQRPPSVAKDSKDKEKGKDTSSERERHPRPSSVAHSKPRNANTKTRSRSESTNRVVRRRPPPPPASATSKLTAEPQLVTTNGQTQPQQGDSPVVATQQRGYWIDDEPVVKSPPEPTRVKSPEQMIMRSPEPVNWTVPLDTGKTFTVTQNVREGEPPTRAHSESRSWIGPGAAQAVDPSRLKSHQSQHQSLHPGLDHHQHQQQQKGSGYKSPESESVSLGSCFSGTNGMHKDDSLADRESPLHTIAKDEPSQESRCLNDPPPQLVSSTATPATTSSTAHQPDQLASDLLDKARDRFDQFWGSKGPTTEPQQ